MSHVQETLPSLQCDRHAVHCVLGPFRAIHTIRCCPHLEFFLHSGLNGFFLIDFVIHLVKERVDLGGSQFLNQSRTLVPYACFTIECGSPEIRKSMSASFTIIFLMTQIVMINNGSLRSLTKCFISNVERFAFMNRTCLRTIWHIFNICYTSESPRSLMCLFNVGILCLQMTVLGLHSFQ